MKRQSIDKKNAAWVWGLSALWMAVVFIMSATPGDMSSEQSGMIVRILLWLFPGAGEAIPMLEFLVRKAAHMTEYAILFLLYRRALVLSGAKYPGMTALVMSACYAATDEWHQGFVAGRGPSPVDVGIDTLGAAAAWGAHAIVDRIRHRT